MRFRYALIVGNLFLTLPGCLHHGGYYPYGTYGPGPSVLPAQPWNGYPAQPGTYPVQPGGYPPGNPIYQPVNPSVPGGYPAPDGSSPYVPTTPGTSPYTPTPANQPNSTYGEPNGSGTNNTSPNYETTPNGSGGKSVPQPGDDDYGRQGSLTPTITPTSGATSSRGQYAPMDEQDSNRLPRDFSEPEADAAFESPVIQTSGSNRVDNETFDPVEPVATPAVSFKKFATSPSFDWIQGVLDYDEPSRTWVLMYNDNPRTSDPYGGELSLADDAALSRLRPGDVVRIYGQLDTSELDGRNKPVYRATRIEPRRPMGK